MKLKDRVLKQGAIYSISNVVSYFFSFLYGIVLARLLSPVDFGVVAFAAVLIDFVGMFSAFSFKTTFIQKQKTDAESISTLAILSFSLGFLFMCINFIISILLFVYYNQITAIIFICYGIANSLTMISSNLFSSILEIDFKYEYLAIIQLINSSLLPIIGIVMAIKGFGVWSLVTIYVLQHIISFGLLWYYSKWAPQFSLNKGLAIDYIRSGYTIMLGRILEVFVVKFDKLFLGYFYLKRDLGFYSRAYNVAETGHYFVSPVIVTMSLPIYSKIKSDKEKMELTLKYVNYLIPRIIYPIVLILSCFSKDFLLLLYGEKWLPAAAPLLMLFPYVLMLPLFENAKSVLFALDRPSLVLRIRFVQSLGLLISLLGLTYLFGWKGAAFSVDISIIAGILLISYYFKSVIKIKLKLASSLALPLSCLALSFVLSWISKGFLQRGFMNMAFQLAVLLMLFYGSVLFFEKKLLKSALSYCIGERFRSRMDKYLGA